MAGGKLTWFSALHGQLITIDVGKGRAMDARVACRSPREPAVLTSERFRRLGFLGPGR
jgi:hypothetical protein